MKKIMCVLLLLFCCGMTFTACTTTSGELQHEEYLRIHIRANSNSTEDQSVKYEVRDAVVQYLIPLVANVSSKEQLLSVLRSNMSKIENVADQVLLSHGKTYTSTGKINNEYFPTRVYGDLVLESDYYDALILELGTGTGDNWWCVVYPPLCFAQSNEIDTTHIRYKSKILEIIQKFFGR